MIVNREFPPEIAAWLQTVDEEDLRAYYEEKKPQTTSSPAKPTSIREALEQIRISNPFKDIDDPVAWQREIRKDRVLPNRQ